MATGKRYYWIKLKESFMTSDTVDFLMGQPDGANYVVLYQMLCLKTINTDGKLERRIGEVIIPYDEQKIARDTKWFSVDTVRVALNLYKALGLVYQDVDGSLVLADHKNLVGSETDYAERNRRLRANQQSSIPEHNVYSDVSENVYTDIDNRDRDIEKREREEISSNNTRAQENENDLARVMNFYFDRVNPTPSPMSIDELKQYTASLGADVVLHALGIALDERKTGWSYIRGILSRYERDGLKNMNAVLDAEQRYREEKDGQNRRATGNKDNGEEKHYNIHYDVSG